MHGEFSFFSYNKQRDWSKGKAYNLQVLEQGLSLQKTEKYAVVQTIHLHAEEGPSAIYDVALAHHGKMFLLDEQANLWTYDYKNKYSELLFQSGHTFFTKDALFVAVKEMLVIADAEAEQSIAAYSATNGQPIWGMWEWNGEILYPLAIAWGKTEYVYVVIPAQVSYRADGEAEIPAGAQLIILQIHLSGQVVKSISNDIFRLRQSMKATHLRKMVHVGISPNGEIYVLLTGLNRLFHFTEEGALVAEHVLPGPRQCSGLCIDANQQLFMGDCRQIFEQGEDDRYISKYTRDGQLQEKLIGFRGKVDKLLLDAQARMYVWNSDEDVLTILEQQSRTMPIDSYGLLEGVHLLTSIDSTVEETVWHKLQLEADIPEETQIRIAYFASDRRHFIRNGVYTDLDQFIMDEQIPLSEKLASLENLWLKTIINPRDALFMAATGRFLWLKIELVGSEQKSPLLKKMRIYFPRASYLSYLPAIYEQDETSRAFLERFLSLYGTFLMQMEETLVNITQYFDVDAANEEFRRWLGTWLGLAIDDSWTDAQVKELLKLAPQLYKMRGTREGIEQMIELYTGERPFIVEYFQYKHLREQSDLKQLMSELFGTNPYSFCVLVKPECVETKKKRLLVEKILNEEKPAFTEAKLVVLEPWIYMDRHTYLGVNTVLSELSLMRLDHKLAMPYDTVIIDMDRDNRMDIHTRLELDSELE